MHRALPRIVVVTMGVASIMGLTAAEPTPRAYTLTVPTADVLALVRQFAFTDSGRAYPCRDNPACSAWGQNLILTSPTLGVDGPRLTASMHVTGTYPINQFFEPQVAGDVVISAIPVVRNNVVYLTATHIEPGPGDMTFRGFIGVVHTRMEQMLEERASFDLAQYLAAASRDPRFPPPRLPDVTNVDVTQIDVRSVATQVSPAAVVATVAVRPPPPR